ncbi:MAG: flagellar hook-basal body protein, partial [Mailhella sp.]|nr:flagellar hook-basal body protein [Mailhella sp.]
FTGNQLDIAIVGEGFYRVNAPQGEYLTRSSAFTKGPDGTIMTKQGYPVQGTGGNIVLPPNASNVHVSADGAVYADGQQVGQLDVVTVEDPQLLRKVGNNLYGVPEGVGLQNVLDGERTMVSQGYTEAANVNVVYEMVNMIEVQRMFEAQQKVMSTANDVDKQVITTVGKAR